MWNWKRLIKSWGKSGTDMIWEERVSRFEKLRKLKLLSLNEAKLNWSRRSWMRRCKSIKFRMIEMINHYLLLIKWTSFCDLVYDWSELFSFHNCSFKRLLSLCLCLVQGLCQVMHSLVCFWTNSSTFEKLLKFFSQLFLLLKLNHTFFYLLYNLSLLFSICAKCKCNVSWLTTYREWQ